MTKLFIISGFLGAGKTTFIENLLDTQLKNLNIALIENDFGEVGMDSEIFRNRGLQIAELNSGCVCCSLNGDFKSTLIKLNDEYHPDLIILEPSGIAKVSELISEADKLDFLDESKVVTIVDLNSIQKYYDNYGDLFDDQMLNADLIFVSHYTNQDTSAAKNIFTSLDIKADVIFNIEDALIYADTLLHYETTSDCDCHDHHHDCDCHDHHHDCDCHDHHHDDVYGNFVTKTIYIKENVSSNFINRLINDLTKTFNIMRIKGFFNDGTTYYMVQYNSSNLEISPTLIEKNYLTIIGSDFNPHDIERFFNNYE